MASQRAAAAVASIQQPHPVSNLRLEDLDSSKPQLDHLAAAAAQHGAQHISPAASLTPGIGGKFSVIHIALKLEKKGNFKSA